MNLNELMVGDWVEDTYRNKFVQWNPRLWFMEINGHMTDRPVEGRDYKPILLTPEILEKNGFEMHLCDADDRNRCYYECADWNIGWCIDIYPLPDGDYYMEIDSRMDRRLTKTLIYRVISSVHELQHGIKYGEIEKEVVV